jgi:predicted GNAT family acetyltransferase
MHIRRFDTPVLFLDRAREFLLQAEGENGIFLSMDDWGEAATRPLNEQSYLATIEHSGAVVGCASCGPPYGLNVTRAAPRALEALLDDVAEKYNSLPSVRGPEPTVSDFADRWSARLGTHARPIMRMRVFEADSVRFPERLASGSLRAASERDLATVERWVAAFHEEAATGIPTDPTLAVRKQIAEGRISLWDRGGPVSMTLSGRRSQHSMGIGIVYTPPEYRRQGYASTCVAALTEQLLLSGATTCYINSDVANPTTNRIYPAIGYRPVCDLSNIGLTST